MQLKKIYQHLPVLKAIYNYLPIALQNVCCSYYGKKLSSVRYSPSFFAYLEALSESEWWDLEKINHYQDEQIKNIVNYSYHHVPYYNQVMKSLKLLPQDIQNKEDLQKLPILTKENIKKNFDLFVSKAYNPKKLYLQSTSGTTGTSLRFYKSADDLAFIAAIWWRFRRRFGLKLHDAHINFTGRPAVPLRQQYPPFWRFNKPMFQTLMNMHHITNRNIDSIIDYLNSHSYEYYCGYPSILDVLASTALEAGLELKHHPRMVTTGSENILTNQRKNITQFIQAPLVDMYGFAEYCGNASQCENNVYHEDVELGYMECLNPEWLPDGRKKGHIVCTGFYGHCFPFLRYEVGDVGIWDQKDKVCACGRHSPVLTHIEGRIEDYILTPEGRKLMRLDHIFKETAHIKECQIVQKHPQSITLRILKRREYSLKDEQNLRELVAKWVSPLLVVEFEYVTAIERTAAGKFKAVVSLL